MRAATCEDRLDRAFSVLTIRARRVWYAGEDSVSALLWGRPFLGGVVLDDMMTGGTRGIRFDNSQVSIISWGARQASGECREMVVGKRKGR